MTLPSSRCGIAAIMLQGYWVVKRKQQWGSDATLWLQAGATGLVLTRSCALWGLGTGLETGLD